MFQDTKFPFQDTNYPVSETSVDRPLLCNVSMFTGGYFPLCSFRWRVWRKADITRSAWICFKWEITSGNTSRHAGCPVARLSASYPVSLTMIFTARQHSCKRCTSYRKSVRPSVRLSVCPSVSHSLALCQNDSS